MGEPQTSLATPYRRRISPLCVRWDKHWEQVPLLWHHIYDILKHCYWWCHKTMGLHDIIRQWAIVHCTCFHDRFLAKSLDCPKKRDHRHNHALGGRYLMYICIYYSWPSDAQSSKEGLTEKSGVPQESIWEPKFESFSVLKANPVNAHVIVLLFIYVLLFMSYA